MAQRKIDILVALMEAGDWPAALSLASKFPRLGAQGPAIKRAHEAYRWPGFYRQIGMDPDRLIQRGSRH